MFEVGCPILTIDLKIVHRRDGDRNRKLYYREQHNRPPDSQGIWDKQKHRPTVVIKWNGLCG